MKIAYILGSLNRGGMETLLLDVFKNASKASCDFIGIHRKDGALKNDFYATKKKFVKLSPRFPFDLIYFYKLRKVLKNEKIQIVHAQQPIDALYAWLATLFSTIKVVLTVHGFGNLNKKNRLTDFIIKRTHKNIFVSQSQRDFYIKKHGLNPAKQKVVYNGISFEKFNCKYVIPDFLKDIDLTQPKLKMAMVGNFVNVRSQDCVCRFLKLLYDEGVSFDFYFVGKKSDTEPWLYDNCVNYCKENELTGCVHFLGSCDNVPIILAQMDAFVYSTDHDTFGIAVVEAIAAGIPVFVNDWGVMIEITGQGEWATIYKTQDEEDLLKKFMQFLQQKTIYQQKAIDASAKVRDKYSIEKHLENLEKEYQSIVISKQ
jgi:glycosyltransferase involved in cell wall biosynthesis